MSEKILNKEREFHDRWAATIDIDTINVSDYFQACTAPENRFILHYLGDVQGKKLLDVGCGAGENSVYFAQKGAQCIASDYSPGMVDLALNLAKKNGVTIEGHVGDATALNLPDNSIDIIYVANLLHHLYDPKLALIEFHRVVKPGGKVCFWEPLKHNPIINVYRRIATKVRTEDETPLDIHLVSFVESLFSHTEWDTFWIATLWIFLRFYLIEKVNPNEERYWKKIILEKDRLKSEYTRLEQMDKWLKKLPGMKRMAWNLAVVATK